MRGDRSRVVVIGAGVGGLAAAMSLAGRGLHVTVLEQAAGPGGKMRQVRAGSALVDGGPTVFTMKHVFDDLFERAGSSFDALVRLLPLDILARHAWADGSSLDLHARIDHSEDAIAAFAGGDEAARFRRFAAETAEIYAMLDTSFMRAPKPPLWRLPLDILSEGKVGFPALFRMKPFETLWGALGTRFRDPRLRQLFGRYATYVGSSPLQSPATLMLIAHAEQRGVWRVAGGMHALARAMQNAAEKAGARFRFGEGAHRIIVGASGVEAVESASGERFAASTVVYNGDVAALSRGLLGKDAARATASLRLARRSLSAVVACAQMPTSGFPLSHHNVFFNQDYPSEFHDIFQRKRMPEKPTVYICAQDREGDGAIAGPGPERLQLLVNAPALGDAGSPDEPEINACLSRATQLIERCGLKLEPGPATITTPKDFNGLFPGTGGAIYGQACHGFNAPFRRPGSATRLPGLYLAGGSVHPGPGVPMAAISGMLAADTILADQSSHRLYPLAATSGGISTR